MSKEKTFYENIENLKKGIVYSAEEIENIISSIKSEYTNTTIKRVCAYGRVSTKYEQQESSLLTQHEVFKSYCERHKKDGYVLVEEVYEQQTATLITKRKMFQQIVEDARAGLYDILLFKSSSRFSRNTSDFVNLIEELKRQKVYIVFISENVNTKTADRNTLIMLGMMAESYSNSLHDSNSTAIRIKQNSELGRVPGNVFGYKRVKGNSSKAEIVPEQAELLKELFKRYSEGEGIASICKDWQARGIRTYNGGMMSMFALRRYIRNPLYKGVLEMGKFTKSDVRAKRIRTPDEDLIVRYRPDLIIVDPELWDECNKIMDANKKEITERGSFVKKTDTVKDKLYCRIIRCGECGRFYNRKEGGSKDKDKKDKRYTYLMCGYKKYNKLNTANQQVCHNEKVLRLDTLNEIMSLFIVDLLKNKENLRDTVVSKMINIIEEMKANGIDKEVEQKLKNARGKLKRFVELYKDGLIDEAEYREQRAEVKRLEEELKATNIINISEDEIKRYAEQFIDNLEHIIRDGINEENMNSDEIKEFNQLFDNITVYSDHVDIVFKMFNDRKYRSVGKIDIKDVVLAEYKGTDKKGETLYKFVCPMVENDLPQCQVLDKQDDCPIYVNKTFERYTVDKLTPYSKEEREYLDSIEDRELRNKIRKKLHRKKKTDRVSIRTSEFMGLTSDAVINQHTNQVVNGLKNININFYVV